ncbi:MAG: hypothetical protein KC619_07175 [Myxococcales bacterium]|nr:hypothetical protein [Myxococcales bacterium]
MRPSRTDVWPLAWIALLSLALIVNDLLPYVGLRDDSCQTMFSGLEPEEASNNHYLAAQRTWSDIGRYYTDVSATLEPPPEPYTRAADLHAFLQQPERELNAEAVRVVVRQLCDRGHRVDLRYRDRRVARHAPDACGEPALSRPHAWIPVRLHDSHIPRRPGS